MISFIIPTLNEEKIIEKILTCLSGYTGEKEIIVSDGDSKDKTVELAQKSATIITHNGSFRQTIAGGRNAGARIAHGEYLLFLDADDFIPEIDSFLKKAQAVFESNKDIVALTVSIRVFPDKETWGDKIFFSLSDIFNRLMNNIFGLGAASGEFQMVRKDIFEKLGGYDEKIVVAEDQEFFRRLAKAGRTYFAKDLRIYHTGRRAHTIGWPKLLGAWLLNGIFVLVIKKAYSKEWKVIR